MEMFLCRLTCFILLWIVPAAGIAQLSPHPPVQEKLAFLTEYYVTVPDLAPDSFLSDYCRATDVPLRISSGIVTAGPFLSRYEANWLSSVTQNAHVETKSFINRPIQLEEAKQLYRSFREEDPSYEGLSGNEVLSATHGKLLGTTLYRFELGLWLPSSFKQRESLKLQAVEERYYATIGTQHCVMGSDSTSLNAYQSPKGRAIISSDGKLFSLTHGFKERGTGIWSEWLIIQPLPIRKEPGKGFKVEGLAAVLAPTVPRMLHWEVLRIRENEGVVKQQTYFLEIETDCDHPPYLLSASERVHCRTLAIQSVRKGSVNNQIPAIIR